MADRHFHHSDLGGIWMEYDWNNLEAPGKTYVCGYLASDSTFQRRDHDCTWSLAVSQVSVFSQSGLTLPTNASSEIVVPRLTGDVPANDLFKFARLQHTNLSTFNFDKGLILKI